MKPIQEMVVLVEPECTACVRVRETASALHQLGFVGTLLILDRQDDPEGIRRYGAIIFPAVFINGRLAFYGEFTADDALLFARQSPP